MPALQQRAFRFGRAVPVAAFVGFAVSVSSTPAGAWLLYEHTQIGRTAAASPSSPVTPSSGRALLTSIREQSLAALESAWADLTRQEQTLPFPMPARFLPLRRLCARFSLPAGSSLFGTPAAAPESRCIDFPMLAAIAGDFACSPTELWNAVTGQTWVGDILEGSRITEIRLANPALSTEGRIDAWHADHIHNFAKDPGYLVRANGNLAHFAWPRQTDRLSEYLADALSPGRPANAYASYVIYHTAALQFANLARENKPIGGAPYLSAIRQAFLSEAFALHYLQDSFSAGHIAGRSESGRVRTGTHDYYCEKGLEGAVWQEGRGELCSGSTCDCPDTYLAHGDAFMSAEDRLHAAAATQRSLHDLSHTLRFEEPSRTWLTTAFLTSPLPTALDACENLAVVPTGLLPAAADPDIRYTLRVTIQPVRAAGAPLSGETEPPTTLPQFSSELGFYLGAFASGRATFGPNVQTSLERWQLLGKMDAGMEGGLGVDGITTSQADGLFWLQAGVAVDSPGVVQSTPAVNPGRIGVTFRLHAPFALFPIVEHIVYTLPALAMGDGMAARTFLVEGAQNGLGGLARVRETPVGEFQLVIGREAGLRVVFGPNLASNAYSFEWPIFEYQPRQWYSGSVGNVFSVQVGASLDVEDDKVSTLGTFLRFGTSIRRYRYP